MSVLAPMCVLSLSHASPQPLSISLSGGLSPPGYPSLLRSTLLFKHSQFDIAFFSDSPVQGCVSPVDTMSLLCMAGELVGDFAVMMESPRKNSYVCSHCAISVDKTQ